MSGRTQIRICILILISKQVVKFKVPIIYYLNVCITIPQNAESRYKNSSKEQDPDIRISQKSRIQIKKFPDINKTVIVIGKKVPTVHIGSKTNFGGVLYVFSCWVCC